MLALLYNSRLMLLVSSLQKRSLYYLISIEGKDIVVGICTLPQHAGLIQPYFSNRSIK